MTCTNRGLLALHIYMAYAPVVAVGLVYIVSHVILFAGGFYVFSGLELLYLWPQRFHIVKSLVAHVVLHGFGGQNPTHELSTGSREGPTQRAQVVRLTCM